MVVGLKSKQGFMVAKNQWQLLTVLIITVDQHGITHLDLCLRQLFQEILFKPQALWLQYPLTQQALLRHPIRIAASLNIWSSSLLRNWLHPSGPAEYQ